MTGKLMLVGEEFVRRFELLERKINGMSGIGVRNVPSGITINPPEPPQRPPQSPFVIPIGRLSGNEVGGGIYKGELLARPTVDILGDVNLTDQMLGTHPETIVSIRMVNPAEVDQDTHDLTAPDSLPEDFALVYLQTASDDVPVYMIIGGFPVGDCVIPDDEEEEEE